MFTFFLCVYFDLVRFVLFRYRHNRCRRYINFFAFGTHRFDLRKQQLQKFSFSFRFLFPSARCCCCCCFVLISFPLFCFSRAVTCQSVRFANRKNLSFNLNCIKHSWCRKHSGSFEIMLLLGVMITFTIFCFVHSVRE